MASSTDRSEDALPRPELNPLLNPLLADNMGRWAEVYFTSPPERREEAVLDLLRELQARNSEQTRLDEARQAAPEIAPEIRVPPVRREATGARADLRRCENCGQDNPPRNQFCGMCGGKLLQASEELRAEEVAGQPIYPHEVASSSAVSPSYTESQDEYSEPLVDESASIAEEAEGNPYDLSMFQTLREKDVPPAYEYAESPSFRYRYYVGAVLALLIVALGYFAWRGAHASQDAQTTPPPPVPVAADGAPTPSTPHTAASAASNAANNAAPQAARLEKKAAEPAGTMAAHAARTQTAAAERSRVPSPAPSAPEADRQQNSQSSGADDFTAAQQYLNGTNGRGRNAAEAVKRLWEAISKHNGPAMVALADLYLKGDGVSKNCDQARILLDSAALRGVAGAGQRLRNLQAFGCQ